MGINIMEEQNERTCSWCKKSSPDVEFTDNRKLCNGCGEKSREKHRQNREKERQQAKEYYERNKEYKKEYNKEYRQWRYECPCCKVMVTFHHKARHERTKKHLNNMNIVHETEP